METLLKKQSTKTKWTLDPSHSELAFKVRHMMITNVQGSFKKFNAVMVSPGTEFGNSAIHVTIDPTTISTGDDQRDAHLLSADFFEVEKYPLISFTGTSFRKIDEDLFRLRGILKIKDTKKEVALDVEFGGINKDHYGNEKVGFSVTGKINRKDFGLTWNAALESGGVLVSDEVKISAEVQFIKQVE